jgi:Tfp pilus assembly protein PilF
MAQYYEQQGNMDLALACYKEALSHDEGSSDAMLALADVYIKKVALCVCSQLGLNCCSQLVFHVFPCIL